MKIAATMFGVLVAIIAVAVGYGYIVHSQFGWDWKESGPFGDSFGALNTIFTGMALAGLAIAIWTQYETQRHQQQEIKIQQDRLDAQERELKIQRSFTLLNEWHTETFHAARTAIHGLTEGLSSESIKSLSAYEDEQKRLLTTGGGDKAEKRAQALEISQIFTVLYFLEKVGFLLEHKMLDEDVTRELFAEPFAGYREFVRTLLARETALGRVKRENWVRLLTGIDNRVFKTESKT